MTSKNGTGNSRLSAEDLIANAMQSRSELLRRLIDPRRDIEEECGYPKGIPDTATYQDLYDRHAVANRVVQVLPRECWQVQPLIYEDEGTEEPTAFEAAWKLLGRNLGSEVRSWYQDERGSRLWECLRRADELSGIGQYGIILLGLNDNGKLDEPVRTTVGPLSLRYVRVFPERLAPAVQFEADEFNPRFGQPTLYSVTLNDPTQQAGVGLTTATRYVHWSRVIHIADNLVSSEVFGVPRMQPVLDNLLALKKLYGGSAEMYWRGAFPGYSLETHPTLGGDVNVDRESVRDMMENYMNGLQRYLALMGMSARSLAPQVVDPTPQIRVQIEAICIKLGIPIRVFMGSERGELASSQDDAAWNDRLRERQQSHITPRIIIPFVDRLIMLGVLPEPSGYSVGWPDLTSQTPQEKAAVAMSKTQALVQYRTSGLVGVLSRLDYLTRVFGMSRGEALVVIKNADAEMVALRTAGVDATLLTPPATTALPASHGKETITGASVTE